MKKITTKITLISIIAIFILAAIFDVPNYFNQGIDYFNSKFSFNLPHFPEMPFKLGLDLQGGTHLIYEADLSGAKSGDSDSIMGGLRDVIERRVNMFGVREPVVQTEKAGNTYRLIIELAGIKDVNEAIKMIGETPLLEFKEVKQDYEKILESNKKIQEGTATGTLEDPFQPTLLTGKYLKGARVEFSQVTGEAGVALQFDGEGTKIFSDLTEKNVGKPLAIFIDGNLLSAPRVNEKISGGQAQITGKFTVQEAKDLANNLSAGALPVPIKIISQKNVGPTLGLISLEKSLMAGAVGFLAVIIFMIVFYRLPGLLSSIALLVYIVLTLALFKSISVTLTLSGIAGFILSIGVAVDANILIFARMREEWEEHEDFSTVIENSFNRAWPSIRDSNFTHLIASAVLFALGTGFVKGFALTLGLGVLISMFSAIFVTRTFLRFFINTKIGKIKWLWVGGIKKFKNIKFNFIKYRKIYYIFSGTLMALSIFSVIFFGLRLGIDFTGGSILEIGYKDSRPSNQEIKESLANLELGEIIVQPVGDKEVILKMKEISQETNSKILENLGRNHQLEEISFDTIGPMMGNEVKQKTKLAIFFSIFSILLYITFAFVKVSSGPVKSWQYGLAGVFALLHDVVIPIGIFAILGRFYAVEISVPIITAFITAMGYSISDTVVVFDRIRENLFKKDLSFEETVNMSLNQTLFRSLNTSLTILFVLFAIFFLGGESLRYFSLALILGMSFGTYSSIFIAPPILVSWLRRKRA
jgi:protein-export membrane protein SecD/preprotein translocase SecF subunit